MRTTFMAKQGQVERKWYVVDAEDQTLGRIASRIAQILRGKHKPQYTPHMDTGDFVIVVNAEKVRLTGNKLDKKEYYSHSGYPGGLKTWTARQLLSRFPERVIRRAVWGMLPSGPLARQQFKKLRVYAGPEHPHQAQTPEPLEL